MTLKRFACAFSAAALARFAFAFSAIALIGCARANWPPSPFTSTAASGLRLTVSPRPLRSLDSCTFSVESRDGAGELIPDAIVRVRLSMPKMEMPENVVVCTQTSPGEYAGVGRFTMAGEWRASVSAQSEARIRRRNFPLTVK